jgi:hypothetical protein
MKYDDVGDDYYDDDDDGHDYNRGDDANFMNKHEDSKCSLST